MSHFASKFWRLWSCIYIFANSRRWQRVLSKAAEEESYPFPKTRWLYLVVVVLSRFYRNSPSDARDVTTYCISLIGAGCRFLVQPSSSISGMRMPRFSATTKTKMTFAPEIGFASESNRYTFYALYFVRHFRFFHVTGLSCEAVVFARLTSGWNIHRLYHACLLIP